MEETRTRIDTLQAIELAEGVEVRLRIAGPLLRGGALALDLVIQWAFLLVVAFILMISGMIVGWETSGGLISLLWFFVWWWYPVFFEAGKWGATPGKKILGLRVVQTSGGPITMGQSILRNFLRYADGMPFLGMGIMGVPTFGFALATCVATRRFQRLGDLAAGTVVIYDKTPPEPVVPSPPPIEAATPAVALRPEEVLALSAFRDRAGLWSEGRREEIADHASELSGSDGPAGVSRIMAMAHWLQERR
ncbi:RDD domain-containing protein [Haloferula helveola]|uniref:RDD domain-containing protein n=1 Tax=Haloferula helveola TaxID=490095 RepID=A0ABM7RN28_9BACT|nr:RDD domain-containing protein [Haloferula helveola]